MPENYEVLCDSERREICITGEINDYCASHVNSYIRMLECESDEDIYIYIQSPGGSVTAGFSIYDAAQTSCCDIVTVVCGGAYSMGAFLAACAGEKGKRYIGPNAEVMIHQPSAETYGVVSDLNIQFRHTLKLKNRLNKILAECCGKSLEIIERDTQRDLFLDAEQAIDYGLADYTTDKLHIGGR